LLPGQIIPGAVATIVGAPVTVQGQPVQVRLPDTTVDVPVQVRGTPAPAPNNVVYVPVSAPQPVAVNIPVQIVGPTINGRYYRDSAGSCYDSFTQQPTAAANCVVATTTSCPPGFVSNGVNCVQVQTSGLSASRQAVNTNSCPAGTSSIRDAQTCAAVAAAQGLRFAGAEQPRNDYPGGCYVWLTDNAVYYNANFGAAEVTSQLLCLNAITQSSMATMTTRYVRDSRTFQCLDTFNSNQVVANTLCGFRRSSHTAAESSQAIPLVTALSVCGGLTIVVALVASGVVLVRRTVSKRVEMRLAASQ